VTLVLGTRLVETDRLVLRRVTPEDLDFFARIHADPEVARYISHGRPRTLEESRGWLDATLSTYQTLSLGQLAVVRRSDGALLGRCGLSDLAVEVVAMTPAVPRCWWSRSQVPTDVSVTIERELGYTFDRTQWGHGYAAEAVGSICDYARDILRLTRMISLIHPDNARSFKVASRFGVTYEGKVESVGRVLNMFVWPMTNGENDGVS
jgi:RimJ/RimL family protein N-acetyltransferase